jgi:hypothetical protein
MRLLGKSPGRHWWPPPRKGGGLFSFCECYAGGIRDNRRPEPNWRLLVIIWCVGLALAALGLLLRWWASKSPPSTDHFSLPGHTVSRREPRKSAGACSSGSHVFRSRNWHAHWGIFFGRASCAQEADTIRGLKPPLIRSADTLPPQRRGAPLPRYPERRATCCVRLHPSTLPSCSRPWDYHLLNLTPGPPPFASMKMTPVVSRA